MEIELETKHGNGRTKAHGGHSSIATLMQKVSNAVADDGGYVKGIYPPIT